MMPAEKPRTKPCKQRTDRLNHACLRPWAGLALPARLRRGGGPPMAASISVEDGEPQGGREYVDVDE